MSLLQRNAHMSLAITMSLTARMAGHVVHEISCTYGWTDYLSETVTSEGDIVMFSVLYCTSAIVLLCKPRSLSSLCIRLLFTHA